MLPIGLLNLALKKPILLELKTGESINGTLAICDVWMNMRLIDVIITSASGAEFSKYDELFIKGGSVKFVRLPEEIINAAKNFNSKKPKEARSTKTFVKKGKTYGVKP